MINPISLLVPIVALSAAVPAYADPFDGTWVADVKALSASGKPDSVMLKNGTYNCMSCTPAYSVAADGAYHMVKGRAYWDETAVKIVDDHTISYSYRKGGKVVSTSTDTVSPDGQTLTTVNRNTNNANGVPIEATIVETRAGAAVAGAHLVSGDWNTAAPTQLSDAAMRITLHVDGDTLHLTAPTGETLAAKFGGPYAPNVGDPGNTMTKAERLGPNAMRLTDMRQGKVTSIATYTVSADGKSLDGTFSNPMSGQSGAFKATKQ